MTSFFAPTQVIIGAKVSATAGEELKKIGGTKALLCADKGVISAGLIDDAKASLEQAGVDYVIYYDIIPNPRTDTVDKGLELYRAEKCDCVLAIGGGSTMDTAKTIALFGSAGGTYKDYEGVPRSDFLPLVAIPTTHGTGSEVSVAAIITDTVNEYKMLIFCGAPRVALLDPLLLLNLPAGLAASTGIDALTHAIESYVAIGANAITDALNIHSIKLIAENLPITVSTNYNVEETSNMLLASCMPAQAFCTTGLGIVHAIAHSLGGMFDAPHGITNAILLPHVMEFNLITNLKKFSHIAELMGEDISGLPALDAAQKSIEAVKKLSKALGIPTSLKALNVDKEAFPKIAEFAMKDGNAGCNPKKATKADIIQILNAAY